MPESPVTCQYLPMRGIQLSLELEYTVGGLLLFLEDKQKSEKMT